MLSASGCAMRRRRLMQKLDSPAECAIVADPSHLMYLANWPIEPFSWSSASPAILLVEADGRGTLVADNLAIRNPETIHVEKLEVVPWYNHSDSPGDRRLAVIERTLRLLCQAMPRSFAVETRAVPAEIMRGLVRTCRETVLRSLDDALLECREVKDADELELLARCMRDGEAGHARAWEAVRPGVTELDVYREVASACVAAAGMPVVVYGDFCSGPRTCTDRGGPATLRRLEAGDLMIMDFSVVIGGYRGDFTNTIAVGNRATAEQRRLVDLCLESMRCGESACQPSESGGVVWHAMNRPLISANPAYRLPDRKSVV